ncbi:pyrrolo-quinoline quinone [Halostagnicola larsenii XH-48]|uniref:Pyrrolo-quinoline quinone n=1 Tax=Halostagnicola larsenii XH-48 TaxID=797299 RepID=W0JPA9_9EURY|nr:PQQ-binding-like beta-propeller repeat protein [Halostagnicola larsenii]AHF99136.1 pyrrolo-quinoline quinone [Halostagnicola larsenii XH-48]
MAANEHAPSEPFETRPLGDIENARSRHMWTRSSVHATDSLVVAGEWDGTVTAFDRDTLETRWSVDHPEHAVGLETVGDSLVVAGRGESGTIAAYDLESGAKRWSADTAEDVGAASRESIFYLPYVVALEAGGDRNSENAPESGSGPELYAAARRYERDGERREWHSTVYAFEADGTVRWRYETDASPISIDLDETGECLAVGYNRCMGEHDNGLVVLETETGTPEWSWDPGTEGDRRVGDVSFDGDRIAVSSHGDKRGYLLGPGGAELWRVDLATEVEIDGETLYAYPNHAYANDGRVAFVTGNTYAIDSRETDGRHPNEHRIAAFDADGEAIWEHGVGGFVHGLAADGDTIVAPCAQNFRVRDPDTHGLRCFSLADGERTLEPLAGIATAATVRDETVGVIEEPVEYHDEGTTRGEYALRVGSLE